MSTLSESALSEANTFNKSRHYTADLWKQVQKHIGATSVDGKPGTETATKTAELQQQNNLPPSGKVDTKTLDVMRIGQGFTFPEAGQSAFFFHGKLAVDADGAPNAYHPDNKGLDYLSNAGKPGNWWGLATDNNKADGNPVIQGSGDPYPGFYVSTTALADGRFKPGDTRRYVDSNKIPYLALPGNLRDIMPAEGLKKGDLAAVVRLSDPAKVVYAIYADVAPRRDLDPNIPIGEGSIALIQALGHNPFATKNGVKRVVSGLSSGILYVVFPDSGDGKPLELSAINERGAKLFAAWGGQARLDQASALLKQVGNIK